MDAYTQRVANNILPLSLAGTLSDAFREWYFTESIEDHEIADQDCELCDQEKLRYHFEIENRHTEHKLWVGSSCILKFQVQVFEDGKLLDSENSKKKLDRLTKKMRLDSCIKALRKLEATESSKILTNALDYYVKNKCLTPKYAFVVFWKLKENKIDHSPSFFKVTLKKDRQKRDLAQMEESHVHFFWPALTSAQRKTAMKYGHKAPTN